MTRDQRERLDDIAEAIHRIRIVVAEATPETEAIARDATLYNLVIVGEAVKHLDDATKEQAPEIPWRQVAGLRDLLTHEYFRIEMDTIR
ncbi:MAG: DUF86 domain-containing protein, partial [Chloroflexi bacterium]|nr:DUF86 domain-containing protein [Chloroflexota bacterium]